MIRQTLFLVFLLSVASAPTQAQSTPLKMDSEHEKVIDDFAKASVNNLSFQNGLNVFIEAYESDEDALYQGFRITHTDREYNGGWKILYAKDIIIKDHQWLPYRAILYQYKKKQHIVLIQKREENKYSFRIFGATYGRG